MSATFEEWWAKNGSEFDERVKVTFASLWKQATLAERGRCEKVAEKVIASYKGAAADLQKTEDLGGALALILKAQGAELALIGIRYSA